MQKCWTKYWEDLWTIACHPDGWINNDKSEANLAKKPIIIQNKNRFQLYLKCKIIWYIQNHWKYYLPKIKYLELNDLTPLNHIKEQSKKKQKKKQKIKFINEIELLINAEELKLISNHVQLKIRVFIYIGFLHLSFYDCQYHLKYIQVAFYFQIYSSVWLTDIF